MVSQFLSLLQLSAGKFQLPERVTNKFPCVCVCGGGGGEREGGVVLLTSSFHSSVVITANRNVNKISLGVQESIYFNCFQVLYYRH